MLLAVLTNNVNILDAAFPDEDQAEKYRREEESKWEKTVDESTVMIVRKAKIDLI